MNFSSFSRNKPIIWGSFGVLFAKVLIWHDYTFWFKKKLYKKRFPDLFEIPLNISGKKGKEPLSYVVVRKNMLYTPKFVGQAKTFRRAMLAHLCRGYPLTFLFLMFLAKNACRFFSVLVLLFALVEKLCWQNTGTCLFTHFKKNTQLRQGCDKIHCIPTWFWLLP